MDKHYGRQEDRGSQAPSGRAQNGQRWNERYRDDERDMRSTRGDQYGGGRGQDDSQWESSGGNLDREDYVNEGEQYRGQRGGFSSGSQQRSQSFGDRGRGLDSGGGYNRGYEERGFSGGHYGGFASEGARSQDDRGQRGQNDRQNYGQTFGRGYAGSDQGSSSQSFSNRGSASQSYGNQGSMGRGFTGRGPKGYQRSDERIKEQLSERLMDDDDIDASDITIEVKDGEATLTGTVGSRQEKRAAEELVESAPGVRDVQNHLRVKQEQSASQAGQSGQSGRAGAMSASGSRGDSTAKSQESTSGQSKSRERE